MSIPTRQSQRLAVVWIDTSSITTQTDFMSLWGIRFRMRYMSKNEQPVILCRLQQYTLYSPILLSRHWG